MGEKKNDKQIVKLEFSIESILIWTTTVNSRGVKTQKDIKRRRKTFSFSSSN